ncbi:hypothetical protein FVD60_13900 [Enterococcus faecium]|uniref:hypothetical protein n=1 Tax=Enterococcus faecium TaxID=1352 RepID=UPI0018C23B68|nr:hypothetical protein [Enterococcus faecium]MBG0392501.1 hypothetical protein [Enterococcus faecium]MCZ1236097.1 hypothetical protein [Enterococcus faecium]HAQ3146530.1 hypothetical protein [Enterococcus faecium]HAQ3232465.1 hypothetical protein [Enterococcus faecium]HAY3384308.1 hypothetical protein [Enterococcus faecium]
MENIISEVGVLGNVLKYKKKKSHERLLLFSASWYQLANLVGRPAFLKNKKILVLFFSVLENLLGRNF